MKRIFLFVLCIILVACTVSLGNTFKLDGTRWTLKSLKGHELLANTIITLEFYDSDRMYGTAGCNNYGAEYTLQPKNGFKVGEGGATEMLCTEPAGVMEQEGDYLNAFWKVTSYKVEETTLSFMNEQQVILLQYKLLPKFEGNAKNLLGKTWQLVSATGMEGMNLSAFTLRFDGTKYSGTTICRDYEGTYHAVDDSLRFPSLQMTTEVNCRQEELQARETYTSLLSTVWQYNVSDTQLELYTDRGKKMVFQASVSYPNVSTPTLVLPEMLSTAASPLPLEGRVYLSVAERHGQMQLKLWTEKIYPEYNDHIDTVLDTTRQGTIKILIRGVITCDMQQVECAASSGPARSELELGNLSGEYDLVFQYAGQMQEYRLVITPADVRFYPVQLGSFLEPKYLEWKRLPEHSVWFVVHNEGKYEGGNWRPLDPSAYQRLSNEFFQNVEALRVEEFHPLDGHYTNEWFVPPWESWQQRSGDQVTIPSEGEGFYLYTSPFIHYYVYGGDWQSLQHLVRTYIAKGLWIDSFNNSGNPSYP